MVSYIRNAWGDKASIINPADVAATSGRGREKRMWGKAWERWLPALPPRPPPNPLGSAKVEALWPQLSRNLNTTQGIGGGGVGEGVRALLGLCPSPLTFYFSPGVF